MHGQLRLTRSARSSTSIHEMASTHRLAPTHPRFDALLIHGRNDSVHGSVWILCGSKPPD